MPRFLYTAADRDMREVSGEVVADDRDAALAAVRAKGLRVQDVRPASAPGGKIPTKICVRCGAAGKEKTITPGSFWIELILWPCLIIPGLVYSVWRVASRRRVCAVCHGDLIPLDTPIGRRLAKDLP